MISHDDSHDDQGKRERSGASAKRSDRGCAVCRRRRVKCDEQKPACASCIRLGLSCSWSSPWKFVELNDNVGKKYDVISTPPRNHSLHTRISDSWQRLEYVPEIKLCVRQHDEEAKSEDGPSSSTTPLTTTLGQEESVNHQSPLHSVHENQIPPTVNAGPTTRAQMLVVALYNYLPTNEPKVGLGEREQPRLTILNHSNDAVINPGSSFLKAAIDSFTLVQAALAISDLRLGIAAVRRYITCLSTFNTALANPDLHHQDEILFCFLVLSLLESMQPISQFGGWASHVEGAIRYMQHRGPRPLRNRYQAVLYHHVKQAAVLWGLNYQQPLPFCEKDWSEVSDSAPLLDHETKLINHGTKIPGILHLSNESDTNVSASLGCLQSLLTSRHDILTWINEFHQRRSVVIRSCNETNFPTYFSSVKENVLKVAFIFQNFNDAWYFSTAWTYLYLIETTYLRVIQRLGLSPVNEHAKPTYASVQSTIDNLCRTIPQALELESGFSGRLSMNLFLRMITVHFEAQKREDMVRWCQNLDSIICSSEQGQANTWLANLGRESYLPHGHSGS